MLTSCPIFSPSLCQGPGGKWGLGANGERREKNWGPETCLATRDCQIWARRTPQHMSHECPWKFCTFPPSNTHTFMHTSFKKIYRQGLVMWTFNSYLPLSLLWQLSKWIAPQNSSGRLKKGLRFLDNSVVKVSTFTPFKKHQGAPEILVKNPILLDQGSSCLGMRLI